MFTGLTHRVHFRVVLSRWGNNAGRRWRGNRNPTASINFVCAHDGFTLSDLVAYNDKHNDANGENNKDGESHNLSWNCGAEGPTDRLDVNRWATRGQGRGARAGVHQRGRTDEAAESLAVRWTAVVDACSAALMASLAWLMWDRL